LREKDAGLMPKQRAREKIGGLTDQPRRMLERNQERTPKETWGGETKKLES